MNRIPEPHELAAAYFARLDAERRAILMESTCGDCSHYYPVPAEYASTPCGYCHLCGEYVLYDDPAEDCDEDFKPKER